VAHTLQDDGFREIQLNGKQLVFLFMAATVVSVVIFLCGVLVGRGVKAERLMASDLTPAAAAAETTPRQSLAAPAPAAGSDPTAAAPPPAVDDLSYFNRLEKQKAQPEQLKPESKGEKARTEPAKTDAAKTDAAKTGVTSAPAPPPPAPVARAKEPVSVTPAASATQDTSGQGFAVQIAALNVRSEAEAIAKRLSSKGYSAYVMSPANGTPSVFRVRVGKFNTRREAESVAARLQKEEQFKPWVTR
jgi:cell division septation protein DedD